MAGIVSSQPRQEAARWKALLLTQRLPPRRDSHVRQRPKRLPHVVEVTKRRVELFRLRGPLPLALRNSRSTTTPIRNEQQNAGDRKGSQTNQNGNRVQGDVTLIERSRIQELVSWTSNE